MDNLSQSIEIVTTSNPPQQKTHQLTQLNLKVNPKNQPDIDQLLYILNNILAYPSLQQAQLHMQANRLGVDDLRSEVKIRNQNSEIREKMELCLCCGFVRQNEKLKLSTHLDQINNIGVSTYLYFRSIKNLIILLLILTLAYSIYSIITNIKASEQYQKTIDFTQTINVKFLSILDYLTLSLGSKQLHPTQQNKYYYQVQCQIGVGVILVWFVIFFVLKYVEKKEERLLDRKTISASDFTIMMENVPRDVTKEELQQKFREYEETINSDLSTHQRLNIVKINIGRPFYLNQLDFDDKQLNQLRSRHKQYVENFVKWIKQRQHSQQFSIKKQDRNKAYKQFKDLLRQQSQKQIQLYEQLSNKIKLETKSETTTVFITFQSNSAMKLITNLNNSSFAERIRYWLRCCTSGNRFRFVRDGVDYKVKIERAPEPEDILWNNLSVSVRQNVKRKLITYTITFTILVISFIIVYALSKAQQTTYDNIYLSLLISLSISSINVILARVIRKISSFQKDQTIIRHQRSFAVKSICANLINTIIIPIIVNYYIKQDIYGKNGLANDIFMLGLTNSFVSPILKLIDISYIINRIQKYIISKPSNRLWINQVILNQSFEYLKFQVGEEYVYLVSLYLFTCFFVSLQPIVSIFALCGYGVMYWVQKYSLFNKMKRPIPGTNLVNAAMFQIVLIGGLVFSLGSLTWSNFMPNGIPKEALLPNIIGLGIGLFVFLIPYGTILALFLEKSQEENLNFFQNRMILSSQYDRLNPVTSVQALKQFQQFFLNKTVLNTVEQNQKMRLEQFVLKNIQSSKRLTFKGNALANLLELRPFFIQGYKNYGKQQEEYEDLQETQNNFRGGNQEKEAKVKISRNSEYLCLLSILNQNKSCYQVENLGLKEKKQQKISLDESKIKNKAIFQTQENQLPISIMIP